ncbi:Uncharacterised protein [Aggregatibacter actinomycetemcomitans]|uniref:DNA-binding protein n=1 Tax=Aggregatibacter actinomycetemcomitans TaxID=714 RepID=UPI0009B7649C|nr:DNA-binding protein [Aggregatibacter actinomycetemcomitans]MCE3057186.1 hypothetical protein [Aggregatibacter actinomycetemcomitans]TYA30894.1 hypothetical protein FXB75_05990 [Aggregatibacter actinomycetemcomitans]TYB05180.1 hypothetical protein FXB90_08670 [Aggregatibacter actinomycetemcomitans]TYB26882.1 hypothetical protein FXB66_05465 [Aggregatibacter actinomycetemcomitans]SSY85135.1 Uncharacterised protein [Aggregatibacter actinomycetemcomitans]
MYELESHYSAQSLVELGLISLPKTKKAILTKAKRENWKCRIRQGKGGGYEYAMSRMFPSMVRTVADMQAMEWVNGDGYPVRQPGGNNAVFPCAHHDEFVFLYLDDPCR